MSDQATADKVLLLLVSGLTESVVTTTATTSLNLTPRQAKRMISATRRRLAAMPIDHDEQLALAILRLNEAHAKAKATQDVKSAIAAQRELDKLLNLYRRKPATTAQPPSDPRTAFGLPSLDEWASGTPPPRATPELPEPREGA